VADGQGVAADAGGVLPSDAERLVAEADERLLPPQRQDRAFGLLPGREGLVVLNEVKARGRAVVSPGLWRI